MIIERPPSSATKAAGRGASLWCVLATRSDKEQNRVTDALPLEDPRTGHRFRSYVGAGIRTGISAALAWDDQRKRHVAGPDASGA
jgi:hypothetical protein